MNGFGSESEAYEWTGQEAASPGWGASEAVQEGPGSSAALEAQLVQELLEITSEEELDQFLGKLVSKVGGFVKSPLGKALGGVLKSVAKTALPMVGSALGTMVAPGLGTAIGGKLGSMASGLLEAQEAETMTEQEAEYEAARRYVRWAAGTARNVARAPRSMHSRPRTVVRSAAIASARRYAPSLLKPSGSGQRPSPWRGRRGPWWGAPVWEPSTQQPAVCQCRCGDQAWTDEPDAGFAPALQGDDDEVFGESYEYRETQEAGEMGQAAPGQHAATTGRWVRRGNRIVIFGA